MRRAGAAVVATLAGVAVVALGGCGPYAQLAQRLDVTAAIAGDTWIAAVGPDRTAIRVLLVARPDASGNAAFAFSDLPSGTAATTTLQGIWTETGSAGEVSLRVQHGYILPSDSSGARRDDSTYVRRLTATRAGDRLVLSGDPGLAGTYVALSESLRQLGTATANDARCAFLVANLAVMTSEIRIIGFGGNAMQQYTKAATYVGTVAGTVRVSVNVNLGSFRAVTTIGYSGFRDFGGVTLTGSQITDTTLGGDGAMSGILRFALAPASLDPAGAATPIEGSIDYGGANAVQIRSDAPVSGAYGVSIDGGGSATVPVVDVNAASPAVADCLALP